ncbi:ATP-binding cassette domain-containing protein, partial [Staphylococcus hominis]|uniref:ATP-binding cassette domain-containing protein n=1 Tax=Staphylococcus hominis TaxID=1290 RepID=UPI0030BAC48E
YQAQSSKLTKPERRVQLIEMMTAFGLEEPQRLLKSYPFELSGGMAQRVALMMALIKASMFSFRRTYKCTRSEK